MQPIIDKIDAAKTAGDVIGCIDGIMEAIKLLSQAQQQTFDTQQRQTKTLDRLETHDRDRTDFRIG